MKESWHTFKKIFSMIYFLGWHLKRWSSEYAWISNTKTVTKLKILDGIFKDEVGKFFEQNFQIS